MQALLTEEELRGEIKKEVEQEYIQSFREGVLIICSNHENKASRVAGEKMILMKIKDVVSGYFDSHEGCLQIIEELVNKIISIVSEFKKEIKSKVELSRKNYKDGFSQIEMQLNFDRRHQIQGSSVPKQVNYSNIVLVKDGVEVNVSRAFEIVVGGYVGPDELLKKFFLDICATGQEQSLFMCLYSVFEHFSRFTTTASSPLSNNKEAMKNNKFLGLLLNEFLRDFFVQDTDGFCKSYPFEGKVKYKTRIRALEKCKAEVDRRLISSSRTHLTQFSLIFSQALDESVMVGKEEYHEKLFFILKAFLLRNIGDFVRAVDDLTDNEKLKLINAHTEQSGDKKIKRYVDVTPDDKRRVEKLFPEAFVHGLTFQQDIEAGETSIIASYFWKYARRTESGQGYTPMGDFISGIIKHKQIPNEIKKKFVAMYLFDTVVYLLSLKGKGKFRKSALIGCIIRAMRWFEHDQAIVQRYLSLPTNDDRNKSFEGPDREFFLENRIKPFLADILGTFAIGPTDDSIRVHFSSNILPNTLTKEQRKALLDFQLAYHQVQANPSLDNQREFRQALERCNGDAVATIKNFPFVDEAVRVIVQEVDVAINPVQPQVQPEYQPQQQLESQPQVARKGGGLFGLFSSGSRRNSGAESTAKQEKQTSSGNSSPAVQRKGSVGEDSGSFKKAGNVLGLMFDPDEDQVGSGKVHDPAAFGGLQPDVLTELSRRFKNSNSGSE